ncbi:D-TA family PLP-dependent enzyme [Agathobaculum sp. Marseille-P7918]|uniref:D-TA family PLP-dependent enzyme n=1 Tax=Agathobaculum sp. Marseille-P7918 TaxID=2479843 RepID=UPI000F642B41|nr:D-TA family PLP-dependent enzyme [Agathobaculum sp. Marseille-P7918]
MEQSYSFKGSETVITPALIYYRDLVRNNLEKAIETAHGAEHLWPHVKSHKMADIVRMSMKFGICRFKCATIAEAEMAASCGAEHIVLSYPLVGPNIERFIKLSEAFKATHFYAIGDNLNMLSRLGEAAKCSSLGNVDVLVDVNMGMNRTGVPLSELTSFCDACASIDGLTFKGLHCYDGHRTEHDYHDRKQQSDHLDSALKPLLKSICKNHQTCSLIIIGGSPSFPCHAESHLTDGEETKQVEVYYSPGTIFVHDYGYSKKFPDLPYVPAAAILTRVISNPGRGIFSIDLGYKGIAADPAGIRGQLLGVEHCEEMFQSEEHWTFRMQPGHEDACPKVGEELFVIPTHICPTSALYPSVIVVENGEVVDEWEVTARNRKITY